jgi:hypothetical protein
MSRDWHEEEKRRTSRHGAYDQRTMDAQRAAELQRAERRNAFAAAMKETGRAAPRASMQRDGRGRRSAGGRLGWLVAAAVVVGVLSQEQPQKPNPKTSAAENGVNTVAARRVADADALDAFSPRFSDCARNRDVRQRDGSCVPLYAAKKEGPCESRYTRVMNASGEFCYVTEYLPAPGSVCPGGYERTADDWCHRTEGT